MSMIMNTYSCLLVDISELTGVHLDLPADFDMSWVLIEGPKLDKLILRWIEGDEAMPQIPDWLKPLWDRFVDSNFDAAILQHLRTLLVFGYKSRAEPNEKQLQEAQEGFESTNLGCQAWATYFKRNSTPVPTFRLARSLIGLIIYRCDWQNILPHHGQGAVFPSRRPSEKSRFTVYSSIDEFYPYDSYFNSIPLGYDDLTSAWIRNDKIVTKLEAVPKDSRGPRLICVHPSEAIWIQQGQRAVLERAISQHYLTSGKINFTDQTINGRLALESSFTRDYVTIDMKEASDRISKSLVDYLFGYSSNVLSCSRATHVRLLDGRVVELHMWAPMGNCLTFPVESLVFWSLVRAGIMCRHGDSCDDIYVFGDDIIVPTKYYEGAIWGLVQAGLVPNLNKTFRKGFFRESCGVDAYHGKDVTPLRSKVRNIETYKDAVSACDLAKRLVIRGYCNTSAYIYRSVSKRFGKLSLTNNPDCQGLIEYVERDFGYILRNEPKLRFNRNYHSWEVPTRLLLRPIEDVRNHAWWHVQDSLLSIERCSMPCRERGTEYPLPRGERLVRGSCSVLLN